MTGGVRAVALPGIAAITAGDDLAAAIVDAAHRAGQRLDDRTIVAVASKVVAKAQGRTVPETEREAAILAESLHEVASRTMPDGRITRVLHTRAGPVLAAAGVDTSDVEPGTVLLLPADPDAAARTLRDGLTERTGARPAVLITDTSGRPWRRGVSDFALGAAGLTCLDDLRGTTDTAGRTLTVTVRNLADEIACLADLVKGKAAGTPVALVYGLGHLITGQTDGGARDLVRTGPSDWFRLGHVEAVRVALARPGGDPVAPPPLEDADDDLSTVIARVVAIALAGLPDTVAVSAVTAGDRATLTVGGPDFDRGRFYERVLTAAIGEGLTCEGDPDACSVTCRRLTGPETPAPDPWDGR